MFNMITLSSLIPLSTGLPGQHIFPLKNFPLKSHEVKSSLRFIISWLSFPVSINSHPYSRKIVLLPGTLYLCGNNSDCPVLIETTNKIFLQLIKSQNKTICFNLTYSTLLIFEIFKNFLVLFLGHWPLLLFSQTLTIEVILFFILWLQSFLWGFYSVPWL